MSEIKLSDASNIQAKRLKIKEAYQRIYNNPFRQEAIMDPALFRYEAAKSYAREYYKFTPRSLAMPVLVLATIVGYQLYLNKTMAEKENEIRSGKITYYERALWSSKFKF